MTILVMDHHAKSRNRIVSLLRDNGYDTLAAGSLHQAVTKLQSDLSIATIVADIDMPNGQGFELLSYLRVNLRFSHIAVIICTELADIKSVVRCIELGARDYLVKPIDETTLLARVQQIGQVGRGRILIVCHDEPTTSILVRALESSGYRVSSTSSCQGVREQLEVGEVDCVVSDLALSEESGIDVLMTVKEIHPSVPVLLVLAQSSRLNESDLIAVGADGVVRKPFNNTDIVKSIAVLRRQGIIKPASGSAVARKLVQLEVGKSIAGKTSLGGEIHAGSDRR